MKYIESVQKEITAQCFEACFMTKKMTMDRPCVENCYQKFLFSINHVADEVTTLGREVRSDFVAQAVGAAPRDRFVEEIFPIGGHSHQQSADSIPWRKRFYEAYQFTDNDVSGR